MKEDQWLAPKMWTNRIIEVYFELNSVFEKLQKMSFEHKRIVSEEQELNLSIQISQQKKHILSKEIETLYEELDQIDITALSPPQPAEKKPSEEFLKVYNEYFNRACAERKKREYFEAQTKCVSDIIAVQRDLAKMKIHAIKKRLEIQFKMKNINQEQELKAKSEYCKELMKEINDKMLCLMQIKEKLETKMATCHEQILNLINERTVLTNASRDTENDIKCNEVSKVCLEKELTMICDLSKEEQKKYEVLWTQYNNMLYKSGGGAETCSYKTKSSHSNLRKKSKSLTEMENLRISLQIKREELEGLESQIKCKQESIKGVNSRIKCHQVAINELSKERAIALYSFPHSVC